MPAKNIKLCSRPNHSDQSAVLLRVIVIVFFVFARPMMLCRLLGHSVVDRWFDGIHRRGICKRCRADMIRRSAGWRPYSSALDDDPSRLPRTCRDSLAAS
jgi:hypothetical protein